MHERDKRILFDEGPHIYTIDGKSDYTSVTRFIHSLFPKFDADKIIAGMMRSSKWSKSKYFGMTPFEIKKQWRENGTNASEAGTKLHYDIECFFNGSPNENDSIEYTFFLEFWKNFSSSLKPYRAEWMVFDEDVKLAGSIDMIFEREDGDLEIYDWKRCKEIRKTNVFESGLCDCVEHLPNSNFWHYSLQLNIYKEILERKYGKKVRGLYLICLHPNKSGYERIKVPNLPQEVAGLFEKLKKNLSSL